MDIPQELTEAEQNLLSALKVDEKQFIILRAAQKIILLLKYGKSSELTCTVNCLQFPTYQKGKEIMNHLHKHYASKAIFFYTCCPWDKI